MTRGTATGSAARIARCRNDAVNGVVLRVVGALDAGAAETLADEVDATLLDRPSRLTVDCSEVTFAGVAAVRQLLAALDFAADRGVDARVVPGAALVTALMICEVTGEFQVARPDGVPVLRRSTDGARAAGRDGRVWPVFDGSWPPDGGGQDRWTAEGAPGALGERVIDLEPQDAGGGVGPAACSELLGAAAHQLRNPLTAVEGFARTLLRRDRGHDAQETLLLERIEAAAGHMLRLVESMLDYAAVADGQERLALETVDLVEVVAAAIGDLEHTAAGKDITIDLHVDDRPLEVMADPHRLRGAVANLVSNAVKFSPSGSSVAVRLRHRNADAVIEVADQGSGIPVDEQDRLFQPFPRISVATPDGERSTGLGLSIARRVAEGHGGSIEVHSRPGEGSTFSMTLPCAPLRHPRPRRDGRPAPERASTSA